MIDFVSMISSQSEILKRNVYLIEKIDKDIKENLLHMKSIYLIRPTYENLMRIFQELRVPRFQEYHFFFTNTLQDSEIKKLAENDLQDKVRHVEEIFMDYSPVNADLYSLDLGSTINLTKTHWDMSESLLQEQKALFQRMTDGLFAIFMSLRSIPYIRYLSKSTACQRLASSINVIFQYFLKIRIKI